jgi:hypothetical protein
MRQTEKMKNLPLNKLDAYVLLTICETAGDFNKEVDRSIREHTKLPKLAIFIIKKIWNEIERKQKYFEMKQKYEGVIDDYGNLRKHISRIMTYLREKRYFSLKNGRVCVNYALIKQEGRYNRFTVSGDKENKQTRTWLKNLISDKPLQKICRKSKKDNITKVKLTRIRNVFVRKMNILKKRKSEIKEQLKKLQQ